MRQDIELTIEEESNKVVVTRRKAISLFIFGVLALVALYILLPKIVGLEDTWKRVEKGNFWWLLAACGFTVLSFGGYVLLFRGVYGRELGTRMDAAASYQITMAGLAATRVFAGGGAGGLALTAWALRKAGMNRRTIADQTLAFLVLTYAVYVIALITCGIGLWSGVLHGKAPFGMTVIPAIGAIFITLLALTLSLVPPDLQHRIEGWANKRGRAGRYLQRAAHAPASFSAGMRGALEHVRAKDPSLFGAIAFWGFSIGVLWAAFKAFGTPPPWGVLIMGYFVGMLANLLPLPGGIGGVDGGMIAAFAAFGVNTQLAIVAVLTYRFFVFWLPTIPGAIAYIQLRRTVVRWQEEDQPRQQINST